MSKNITSTAIGFRVTPSATHYAVVQKQSDGFCVIAAEKITHPKALHPPDQLKHIRQTVFDLIREHQAAFGGIKLIEGNSQTRDPFRLNVEGVVQESFASSPLDHYFFGTIPKLTGVFRFEDKKKMKAILDGATRFDPVDLASFGKESREAIVSAVAAFIEHGN